MDDLLEDVFKHDRACPQPKEWQALWKMLPKIDDKNPRSPLVLCAWYGPDEDKKERFREHLEWADSAGVLDQVYGYLRILSGDQWHIGSWRPDDYDDAMRMKKIIAAEKAEIDQLRSRTKVVDGQ